MFLYEKKLQFPVKVATPNPKLASFIISQYGGPDGELGAAMRYLSQRYAMPYAEAKGLLTDIGTEELGHMEMVAALVHQLTRNLSDEEVRNNASFAPYFVDHTTGVYPTAASGFPWSAGGMQSTGDVIAAVSSSASVLHYSDVVTYEDNRTEQVEILSLPCPVFAGGEKLVMQRGAGLCVVKSTPEREKACMMFLKWLSEPERNVALATALGYMPVTKAGFDRLLPAAIETLEDPMYVSLYEAFLQTRQEYTFYVPPQREDYLSLETRFEKTARLRLTAGRAQYLEQGADALAPLLRTTLAEVQGSYDK